MTYKTLAEICGSISSFSMIYMYLIAYEGTDFGWTIFFVFLAFAILFNELDKKDREIEIMNTPKKVLEEKSGQEVVPHNFDPFYISDGFNPNHKSIENKEKIQVIFHRKNPKDIKDDEKR